MVNDPDFPAVIQMIKHEFIGKSWEVFCQQKTLGGSGFQSLEEFKKALFAKQCRQLNNLASRVLKTQ